MTAMKNTEYANQTDICLVQMYLYLHSKFQSFCH